MFITLSVFNQINYNKQTSLNQNLYTFIPKQLPNVIDKKFSKNSKIPIHTKMYLYTVVLICLHERIFGYRFLKSKKHYFFLIIK